MGFRGAGKIDFYDKDSALISQRAQIQVLGYIKDDGGNDWAEIGGAHVLIDKKVLDANAPEIEFTNIPADYSNLRLIARLRSDRAANVADEIGVRFNDVLGMNYYASFIQVNGGAVSGGNNSAQNHLRSGIVPAATAVADVFSTLEMTVSDYSRAAFHSFQARLGGHFGTGIAQWTCGEWRQADVISSLQIVPIFGTNLLAGSRAYLYGEV